MAAEVFTDDWARAWCEQINASDEYAGAARTWEGAVVLQVRRDPASGIERDRAIYADLWHGECRKARVATADDLSSAPYVIQSDPHTWNRVLNGELDPLLALMRGKLKLVKGNLTQLTRYVWAARELVACAGRVETSFPEGWPDRGR